MHLIKLELSGFKSFARNTVLEFPSKIVAVVGPNGSGKSNIAEAIRWVLGEQSMKMLRGKKGEDLIWNGSAQTPRMGKASATLFFDNRDHAIPIEFDEVALGRKIFRDGSNEYLLNGSAVRLKDVVELGARLGLGEAKHNLIGQGEVDRVLLVSPRDRREMLEEALGLRVYQLKKNEAERKLDATVRNLEQVEGLLREIAPHLKFLKMQARRAEMRGEFTHELTTLQQVYFAREGATIASESAKAAAAAAPLLEKRDALNRQIKEVEKEIAAAERKIAPAKPEERTVSKLTELQDRRREYERELGRLEGKRDAAMIVNPASRASDMRDLGNEMRQFINEVRSVIEDEEDADAMRAQLRVLLEDIEHLLDAADSDRSASSYREEARKGGSEFDAPLRALQEKLAELGGDIAKTEQAERAMREAARHGYETIRAQDTALRVLRDQEREVMLALERLKFEEGRLRERETVFLRERKEAGYDAGETRAPEDYPDMPQEELRRKIERMRLKLEEIGGIDESVAKEYEETEARHAFLTRELGDLKTAHASLKTLIKELDARVRSDFKEGFARIKNEFHDYFKVIFGGGSARLSITKQELRIKEDGEETGEEENEEEGIEIDVDLPRKRIKGLAMLSGGERALTAVALLFAIAAVNPPPFLVLDETDAALDEANSRRYASILKELAKKTQLVVITHNRETMQCAGILYGVTMGDDGTSRLLSLKLEDAEEYTNR